MKSYNCSDFTKLGNEIARLFQFAERDSFFSLPGWYALVADRGLDREWRAGLSVGDDAQVALVWCHNRDKSPRALRSCTNAYTCEYDVLHGGSNLDTVRAFAKNLVLDNPQRDYIRLEGLDPAKPEFAAVIDGFRAGDWVVKPYFGWGSWFEMTNGLDFASYLAARPTILQNTWKRKSSALKNSARSAIRFYSKGDDLAYFIDAYELVQSQSWKQPEPFRKFVPGLIRLAAENDALRLGVLEIDGRPAAAQIWIVWAGNVTIFKLVHAEEFAVFSPGTVLSMQMMQTVLESDRPNEINFGRGDDAYKKLWLSSRRERWGIEAANPRTLRGLSPAGKLALGLGRDRLKKMLGQSRGVGASAR